VWVVVKVWEEINSFITCLVNLQLWYKLVGREFLLAFKTLRMEFGYVVNGLSYVEGAHVM